MRRTICTTSVLIVLLLQSACSFDYQYLIVNASRKPLMVEYRFKAFPYAESRKKDLNPKERHFYHPPAMINFEDLKDQKGEWKNVLETNFTVNDETGEVKITVPAGNALRIYRDSGEALEEKSSSFPIEMLSLTGDAGRILLEGKMILKQFGKFRGVTYQMQYQ